MTSTGCWLEARDWGLGIIAGLLFAACSATQARADAAQQMPGLKIAVRVYNYAQVSPNTLRQAQDEAARIFREIGIEIGWMDCTPSAKAQPEPACVQPLGPLDLILRVHARIAFAGAGLRDTALGFSLLTADQRPSAYATVFYDCVREFAERQELSEAQILAYAIAHEFGHLLLNTMGHSPLGLMRARWSRDDLLRALRFTPAQAALIRADVQRRKLSV